MNDQPGVVPRAISTIMLKGGTTKSTITANTAEALGRAEHDVLAVDTDPNGHLSTNLGFEEQYSNSDLDLGDVILSGGSAAPHDLIYSTDLGFDLLPASATLESVESRLKDEMQPSLCLKQRLVEPLLGQHYDFILFDTHSSRNMLTNNAVVAAPNLVLPLIPEHGINNGLTRTQERIIQPLQEKLDLQILALVPNKLSQRIDHQNEDRHLIERVCRSDALSAYLPSFAYLSPETLDAIDRGEFDGSLPKPGLRKDADLNDSFKEEQTLGAFNPKNSQLEAFDELAEIIIRGEVVR